VEFGVLNESLSAHSKLLGLPKLLLQSLASTFQRLVDRFGGGCEAALQHRKGEPNDGPSLLLALSSNPICPIHLFPNVLGHLFVKRRLWRGQFVTDDVGLPLGKERSPIKLDEAFLNE